MSDLAAGVLRCPAERLDVQQSLSDFGLDSLMAIDLRNRVRAAFDVDLPVVKFMEGLSITGLAELVDQRLGETRPASVAPFANGEGGRNTAASAIDIANGIDTCAPEQLLAQLDQLSDEEISALLSSTTEGP